MLKLRFPQKKLGQTRLQLLSCWKLPLGVNDLGQDLASMLTRVRQSGGVDPRDTNPAGQNHPQPFGKIPFQSSKLRELQGWDFSDAEDARAGEHTPLSHAYPLMLWDCVCVCATASFAY